MSENKTELQLAPNESVFSVQTFEHAQRIAKMLASSSLIPQNYQGRIDNVMIAMEMSSRMNISPLMVMQNLYIVKGTPGWSGKFVIAMINGSRRFDSDLDFEFTGEIEDYGCVAYTTKKGKRISSTKVDWKMVKAEGWFDKPGSKWKTMPDQMFMYRSASFFGNAFCPDLLMGMQTAEEIIDITPPENVKIDKEKERVRLMIEDSKTLQDLEAIAPHVGEDQLDLFTVKKDQLTAKK
jgi:hypothetical protein